MKKSSTGCFYALCLFLACLSAALLGYSCGSTFEPKLDRSRVTDIFSIEQEGTVEAQGSYIAINDRGVDNDE